MPYKSKAQARAMHAKASRGEIPAATVREFDRATDFSKIPNRVKRPAEHPNNKHRSSKR